MRHKPLMAGPLLGCLIAVIPCVAIAGPFADDMAKCLVKSTSDADRTDLVRWMFSSMSLHPDLASMSTISAQARNEIDAKVGKLYARLLFESCKSETAQAVQNEGPQTIQYAFQILGQVAARGLFTDPHVTGAMQALEKNIDQAKLKELMAASAGKGNAPVASPQK
jgi:hypothetical protein